jgi:hypothetical protein
MSGLNLRDPALVARCSASGPSEEPELSDWVSRVQGRGSDVTGAGVQTAYANFLIGLKIDSLLPLAYRIGAYSGDGLVALEAPLYKAAGATIDTLTGFVSGDYSATGLVGGTGKRLRTGLDFSMVASINDFSMGLYARTSTSGCVQMGCATSGDTTRGCFIEHSAANVGASMWDTASEIVVSDASGVGFYLASRVASNDLRLYKNGSQIGSTATSPGNNSNLFEIWVHDACLSNAGWAPSGQSYSFYWIGKGLNNTQQGNLRSRVQTLQTALSRQV